MSDVLLDSYSESNRDGFDILDSQGSGGTSQSFTTPNDGKHYKITSAKFYLTRYGNPPGNYVMKLYTHQGVYGSSSKPDVLLATSDSLAASGISVYPTWGLKEAVFSGANQVVLDPNTHYVISLEYSGGDNNNSIMLGTDQSSSGASGNPAYYYDPDWWDADYYDACFYVYGLQVVSVVSNFFAFFR